MRFNPKEVKKIEINNTNGSMTYDVKFIFRGANNAVFSATCTDEQVCKTFGVDYGPIIDEDNKFVLDSSGTPIFGGKIAIRVGLTPSKTTSLTIGPPPPKCLVHAQAAGVATITDNSGSVGGIKVGIMQQYDGSLVDYREKHGTLTDKQASDLAASIAVAKDNWADKNGVDEVTHSDIKPGNLLYRFVGNKLYFGTTDLDGASAVGDKWSGDGTHGYISASNIIKAADGGNKAHEGIDAFAIGSTLYELVTGKPHQKLRPNVSDTMNTEEGHEANYNALRDIHALEDNGARMVHSLKEEKGDRKYGPMNWTEMALSYLMVKEKPNNTDLLALSYMNCSPHIKELFSPKQHLKIQDFIKREAQEGRSYYAAFYALAAKQDPLFEKNVNPTEIANCKKILNRLATKGWTEKEQLEMGATASGYITKTNEIATNVADHAAPIPTDRAYKIKEFGAGLIGKKLKERIRHDEIAKDIGTGTSNLHNWKR